MRKRNFVKPEIEPVNDGTIESLKEIVNYKLKRIKDNTVGASDKQILLDQIKELNAQISKLEQKDIECGPTVGVDIVANRKVTRQSRLTSHKFLL